MECGSRTIYEPIKTSKQTSGSATLTLFCRRPRTGDIGKTAEDHECEQTRSKLLQPVVNYTCCWVFSFEDWVRRKQTQSLENNILVLLLLDHWSSDSCFNGATSAQTQAPIKANSFDKFKISFLKDQNNAAFYPGPILPPRTDRGPLD